MPLWSARTASALRGNSTYSGESLTCSKYLVLSSLCPCETGEYPTLIVGQSDILVESISAERSGAA